MATKFAAHAAWLKAINADKTLRDINVKARNVVGGGVDIVHVAKIIAEGGANGHGSYVGKKELAEIFGCDPKTIYRLRKQLIDLGWLVVTSEDGGQYKNGLVLTISIPGGTPAVQEAPDEPESNAEAAPVPAVIQVPAPADPRTCEHRGRNLTNLDCPDCRRFDPWAA